MSSAASRAALLGTRLGLMATLAPSRALAYEDQVGLAAGLGYSLLASDTTLPMHGVAARVGASLGVGDTFELRLNGAYAFHFGDEPMHRAALAFEAVYLVDILEVVPFLGLGIGGILSVHERMTGALLRGDFELHAVLGFDWLLSREFSIGLEARPTFLLTALSEDPIWITITARAQLLFEI